MNRFVQHFGGIDRSQHHQVHSPQPVRLSGPPAGQVARAARRHGCVRHEGHQRPVRHHPGTQGRSPDRVDPGRKARRTSTSPRTTSSSSPTALRSKTPPGGTTTPRPSGTGTSRRAASGRCGATSPPRTPPSVGPTSSAPTPTRPAMSRHASSPSTTRFRPTSSGSASATRSSSTVEPHHRRLGDRARFQLDACRGTSSATRTSGTSRRTS